MHGTQAYSAAEIKAECEKIWNDYTTVCNNHFNIWHFWHIKKCGYRYGFLTCLLGRIAKFKDYRAAQMRRIRKHQVYGFKV